MFENGGLVLEGRCEQIVRLERKVVSSLSRRLAISNLVACTCKSCNCMC